MNLFCDRMRVGIADTVPTGIARATAVGISEASMALDGYTDIPDLAKLDLAKGVSKRDGPALLRAFWTAFASQVKLEPVDSRLLVNPPVGLSGLGEGQMFTAGGFLKGSYGSPFKDDPLIVSQIAGTFDRYFDDVTVFYTEDRLPPIIMPGSTITLVRPNLKKHGFWMAWAELDLNFVPLLSSIKEDFGYKTVLDQDYDEFTITILGIEAK